MRLSLFQMTMELVTFTFLLRQVRNEVGDVNILVNNAGIMVMIENVKYNIKKIN